MPRLRRFRVDSLQGLKPGDAVALPESEVRHLQVLRLAAGTEITVFDGLGRSAAAKLSETTAGWRAELISLSQIRAAAGRLVLATAWPKGKRAALLVEKCSELGVNLILPVRFARSVVHKTEGSASLARLQRIAAEAAKQCGRNDEPEIGTELTFSELLAGRGTIWETALLLDARADATLLGVLFEQREALREQPLLLIVGPEGGLAPEEMAAASAAGIVSVRLARHVLRVETAALAACAIAEAIVNR